jgi:uncharacterized protein YbjT (DUF2867 family)
MNVILVTGAAGKAGSAAIRELAQQGVSVRALVRNPAKAESLAELSGVEPVVADMRRRAELMPVLEGVDRVLLISSPTEQMVDAQISFIDAAEIAGVAHVVKFSGKESGDGFDPEVFRGTRWHGQIERYLERSTLTWTHLRPSQFMQNYLPTSITGFDPTERVLTMPIGEAQLAPVDLADVAKVAVGLLTTEGHAGRSFVMTGPEALGMTEVADRVTAATGESFRYVDVPLEEKLRNLAAAGLPPDVVELFEEQFVERRRCPKSVVDLSAHHEFGVEPTTFARFAEVNAATFLGALGHG